ncbi:unnamed protein product [Blepharisma stoltei]|uniref:LAGLIDADG homing endonuclease n=1 Tax=Blepharisma stoltei TaxID=1481888 RepID=A0AAU9J0Y4_9CILI|nr:unnamed protein product [Blepharisma stoltei]
MGSHLTKSKTPASSQNPLNFPEEWLRIDYVFRCLSTREVKILFSHLDYTPTTITNIGNVDTPIIFYCICNSRLKILKCLVEELNADLRFVYKGETALTTAIINNCYERFHYLITLPSIDINQVTTTKSSAIIHAAKPGKEKFFTELCEINVNLDPIGKHKNKSELSRSAVDHWYTNRVIKVRLLLFWKPFQKEENILKNLPQALVREIAEYI